MKVVHLQFQYSFSLGLISVSSRSHLSLISVSSRSHLGLISVSSQSHLSLISVSSQSHLGLISVSSRSHLSLISVSSQSHLSLVSISISIPTHVSESSLLNFDYDHVISFSFESVLYVSIGRNYRHDIRIKECS